jgi:hypothetical protein
MLSVKQSYEFRNYNSTLIAFDDRFTIIIINQFGFFFSKKKKRFLTSYNFSIVSNCNAIYIYITYIFIPYIRMKCN